LIIAQRLGPMSGFLAGRSSCGLELNVLWSEPQK
jgi:hypothetical protein